ncbi:hypothetical protein HYALB_00002165 [Hymenoscyphus albidus]|uniref:Acyltransferase 3 domain-containing protein n=1 Tax=Hymenoscyphus albidus TaxID=595503 RepID=A0A9N9Q674_9HELO|nr:hypothetical protein HYALB_00002165 [Hymenoscyphus albidus]
MPTDGGKLSAEEEKLKEHEERNRDLENGSGSAPPFTTPKSSLGNQNISSTLETLLCYPPPDSLRITTTSWLDGVRGVAALTVYIFHAMAIWASTVPAWHADANQNSVFQMPLIRTIFVSGGSAVAVFFALSGYVLTYKSMKAIRKGSAHLVYPAVASSAFRRGFRLFLPPVILTFCEMIATRFGFYPPLSFSFVMEPTFAEQFKDWLWETNKLINPYFNAKQAILGSVVDHPKYDAVIWTIPLEYYGSLACYSLLLIMTRIPSDTARVALLSVLSILYMGIGSWNMFCFTAGILISNLTLSQEEKDNPPPSPKKVRIYTIILIVAFYIAGLPTMGTPETLTNPMPGFETLRALTPKNIHLMDLGRFWWSISGVSILLCISQLPRFKRVFESNLCQYFGKISFSLYLVHEFCIIIFGLALQRTLCWLVGVQPKAGGFMHWVVCVIWFGMFTGIVFGISGQVERWIDRPSVMFSKWFEGRCRKWYAGTQ